MAFNNSFTAVVGATYTAAQYNTYVRDNFTAIWVYTTAGDIVYATSATALARLAKPSVDSVLKNTYAGTPSWLSIAGFPGRLHTYNLAFTDSIINTTSTSFATALTMNLTITETSFVLAWAFGAARKNSGSHEGRFVFSIAGVQDGNEACSLISTSITPFSTMYRRPNVAAGTQAVTLLYRTLNAGDALYMERAVIVAVAFVE